MTHAQLRVGERYLAKVSGRVVLVRLDALVEVFKRQPMHRNGGRWHWEYDATNLATNRRIRIRSCQRFRSVASDAGRSIG